jgi:predicted short-subunit dehydrogenase-like oxidoreductase (DUF2520 family)
VRTGRLGREHPPSSILSARVARDRAGAHRNQILEALAAGVADELVEGHGLMVSATPLAILGPGRDPPMGMDPGVSPKQLFLQPLKPSGISMRELERDLPDHGAASDEAAVAELPSIAVVGAGRAGSAIHRAARGAALRVAIAGRADAAEACASCELALLCVPDSEIEQAAELAAENTPPIRYVGHVSGATGLDALSAPRERGAGTFTLHPLQTLPDGNAELTGAACAVGASDEESLTLAVRLARALGMKPFAISEEQRAAYHAGASMASNFLVALEESASALLEAAGVDRPREVLSPLVLRTAANWSERGNAALTGPIARGDEATVARQREAIATSAPELLSLYDELAARTRALAKESSR